MAAKVDYYERRDGQGREEVGQAALMYCRASRAQPGIRSSQFYWTSSDAVAILTFGEDAKSLDPTPGPEMAKAIFGLGDVARQTRSERWTEAREGQAAHGMRG